MANEEISIKQDSAPQNRKNETEVGSLGTPATEAKELGAEIGSISRKDAEKEKQEISLDTPENPKK